MARSFFFIFFIIPIASAEITEVRTSTTTAYVNENVTVEIGCDPSTWIKGWEIKIRFNQTLLSATSVSMGNFFNGYQQFPMTGVIDNINGTIINIYNLIVGKTGNVSASGTLVYVNFTMKGIGRAVVTLYDVGVCNETRYLPVRVMNGSVTVLEHRDDLSTTTSGWNIFGMRQTTTSGWNTFGGQRQISGWTRFKNNEEKTDGQHQIALQDIIVPIACVLLMIGLVIIRVIYD